jgi:signal peptidase I
VPVLRFNAKSFKEAVKTVFWAVFVAVIFRSFFFQPFSIPSGSMKPTLLIGDFLFVSKYAYGWSQYSFPFSFPKFNGRLMGKQPERGDVVVFKLPTDTGKDYVKRLIGLPGDKVQIVRGHLFVNGKMLPYETKEAFVENNIPQGKEKRLPKCVNEPAPLGGACIKYQFRESFPSGKSYNVLNSDDNFGGADNTGEYLVPEGYYFFMGDNRDNSTDSRYTRHVGMVAYKNLIGRAELIFLSSEGRAFAFWKWRLSRFLKIIE